MLHCLDWRNISGCLSGIIAPLFPSLHAVVGIFKGFLGDPFIAKLFDFVVGFRWYKPCVNIAGSSGGGAGWISPFHVNYICRAVGVGPDWCRASNAAANIVSMSSSVSKSLQKDESLSLRKSLSSMT